MMNFMQERNFFFGQLIRERIPLQRAAVDFEKFESGLSGKFILLPNQLLVNPWDFDFQLYCVFQTNLTIEFLRFS